jgi:hypothetical protein
MVQTFWGAYYDAVFRTAATCQITSKFTSEYTD